MLTLEDSFEVCVYKTVLEILLVITCHASLMLVWKLWLKHCQRLCQVDCKGWLVAGAV